MRKAKKAARDPNIVGVVAAANPPLAALCAIGEQRNRENIPLAPSTGLPTIACHGNQHAAGGVGSVIE
jgi:hypothetical protein